MKVAFSWRNRNIFSDSLEEEWGGISFSPNKIYLKQIYLVIYAVENNEYSATHMYMYVCM